MQQAKVYTYRIFIMQI